MLHSLNVLGKTIKLVGTIHAAPADLDLNINGEVDALATAELLMAEGATMEMQTDLFKELEKYVVYCCKEQQEAYGMPEKMSLLEALMKQQEMVAKYTMQPGHEFLPVMEHVDVRMDEGHTVSIAEHLYIAVQETLSKSPEDVAIMMEGVISAFKGEFVESETMRYFINAEICIERNKMWIPKILAAIKENPDKEIVVAAGCAHMYGEYGLISLLSKHT